MDPDNLCSMLWRSNEIRALEEILRAPGALSSASPVQECRLSLHAAEIGVLRAALNGRTDAYEACIDSLHRSKTLAENLSGSKSTAEKLVGQAVLAESLMFKGAMQLASGGIVKGPLTLRKAWKQFEALAMLSEKLGDENVLTGAGVGSCNALESSHGLDPASSAYVRSAARFGVGMYTLAVSVIPKSMLRIIEFVVGIQSDQLRALNLLRLCADSPGARSYIARLLIVFAVHFLGNEFSPDRVMLSQEATRRCADLHADEQFQRGFVVAYVESALARAQWQLQVAVNKAQTALGGAMEQIGMDQTCRFNFSVALARFYMLDWDGAACQLEAMMDDPSSSMYTARCMSALVCALSHAGAGRTADAMRWFKLCDSFASKSAIEQRMKSRSEAYQDRIRKGWPGVISAMEYIYAAGVSTEGCSADYAEQALRLVSPDSVQLPAQEAVCRLVSSAFLRPAGRLQESEDMLQPILTGRLAGTGSPESFVLPFGYFELCRVRCAQGRFEEALAAAEKSKKKAKKGCAWDRNLFFKLKSATNGLEESIKRQRQ